MPKLEIQLTADNSATLYLPELDEHYHSIKGALTESLYIYRDCGTRYRLEHEHGKPLRVLEIGFGTGLNAAVTAGLTETPILYTSLELYPVTADMYAKLGYDLPYIAEVNNAAWNERVAITPTFTLEKLQADFLTAELPTGVDVVYFDAFAPEKQPEMWSEDALRRLVDAMSPGGVLTTYCAKGTIRRLFGSLGLKMERLAGPPGGKREILRGTKL
jgi:tRNA U34 5-methylaminomethyl-2-thiouridine-forming methyltransferase MnmC